MSNIQKTNMITLNEFEKNKLAGFVYPAFGRHLEALQSFEDALMIKEDGQIYFQMALSYADLKEYKKAQECTLKAIKNDYDAYNLFAAITVGNLANIDLAVKVLLEGAEKENSSACLALANLYTVNYLNPDMEDPLEAIRYLEMAYEYAKPSKKGLCAFQVYNGYSMLLRSYPFLENTFCTMPMKYLNIFNEYGGSFGACEHINVTLFQEASKVNDHSIVETLFNRFNGDAELLFALMLLEEEYRETGKQSNVISDLPLLLIKDAAKTSKNSAALLLNAISTQGSKKMLSRIFAKASDYEACIPACFKKGFDAFIKYYEELLIESNEA